MKQILESPFSLGRVAAVKKLHSIILQRGRRENAVVKRWIRGANAARRERGGSLVYSETEEAARQAVE